MFYGNFSGERKQKFQNSLKTMQEVFGRVYAQDNLIAVQKSVGFFQDEKFRSAFTNHATTEQEKSLGWRLHTLTWAASNCLSIPGDFVECGVYRGFSFAVVSDYLNFENVNKNLYLYDTFEGIPEEYNSEKRSNQIYQQENSQDKDAIYKHVQKKFSLYNNVKVVRGIVPDTFSQVCPEKIALLHIDMNSAKSEIAALEVLFDRVSPGGMIVFDDYGWSGYVKQKIAEDEFMKQRGHSILELPTGQGLLIKK